MALGMDLIIVDEAGHWLQEQNELSVNYRQHFLKADIMKVDDTLPERIAEAIRSLDDPIDGILTVSDRHLVPVARAAEKLGLPTAIPRAYEISVSKYESRLLQENHGLAHLVSNTQEANDLIETLKSNNQAPKFPLIVKPTMGWSSECVSKVENAEELLNAVNKATSRHGTSAVIESYIRGIEIDVNFILCEGEILFVEIVDELPTTAESPDLELLATFLEQGLTQPSQLSQAEQHSATNTLYDLLLKCGFHTGCFHVEARLEDHPVGTNDFNINQHMRRCRLIEINARPMGFTATLATTYTYGVDFYAARLLSAVGDHERLRALSSPFTHTAPGSGAQFWLHSVYISASRGGIVRTEDAIGNLLQTLPHASKYIIDSISFFEAGDVVPDPASGVLCFLACFMVASTHSAAEAERIGDEIRENFSISLEHNE